MWILVFIYIYANEPYAVKYGSFNSMYECFFARESLGKKLSGNAGYFLEGSQAICIYKETKNE